MGFIIYSTFINVILCENDYIVNLLIKFAVGSSDKTNVKHNYLCLY